MTNKKSDKWDKDEKDNASKFNSDDTSYSGSYPYLPKKVTIVFVVVAILMGIGMLNNLIDPPPRTLPTAEQIEAMSCMNLQEFLEKNIGNLKAGMNYWVEDATVKFLDECSSYGK